MRKSTAALNHCITAFCPPSVGSTVHGAPSARYSKSIRVAQSIASSRTHSTCEITDSSNNCFLNSVLETLVQLSMMLLLTTYHASISLSSAHATTHLLTISGCPESVLPRCGCAPRMLRGKVEETSSRDWRKSVNLALGSGPTYAAQTERTIEIPIAGVLGPER